MTQNKIPKHSPQIKQERTSPANTFEYPKDLGEKFLLNHMNKTADTHNKIPPENFKFTREWFMNKDNQVHTRQDVDFFNDKECKNIIEIGEHFLLDLIPIDNDVEIWESEIKVMELKDFKNKIEEIE